MTRTIDREERFLRAKEAAGTLGIAVSTLWLWAKQGKVPQPVKITPSTTVWLRSELRAYMEKVINQDLPKNEPVKNRDSNKNKTKKNTPATKQPEA